MGEGEMCVLHRTVLKAPTYLEPGHERQHEYVVVTCRPECPKYDSRPTPKPRPGSTGRPLRNSS